MRDFTTVPLAFLQRTQPWTIPYNAALNSAVSRDQGLGHLMGAHVVLHVMKTSGQIAAVFENMDHTGKGITDAQRELLMGRCADLVTAAMRLANLYSFELAEAVVARSEEKNRVTLPPWV